MMERAMEKHVCKKDETLPFLPPEGVNNPQNG
jgi:hypothetical protein